MFKKALWLLAAVAAVLVYLQQTEDQFGELAEAAERRVMAMDVPAYSPVDVDASATNLAQIGPPGAQAPNIILILADDMGWRDMGYHQSEIQTPVMDRLASEGVTFNRFYVQPTCSPTRAALLTGRTPLRLGVLDPLSKLNPRGLPLSETTIADKLRENGYSTALVGKWHLGSRNLAYHPNARGFDHFYGHLTGAVGYYDKVHGGGYDWQRNGKTVREEGYTTQLLAAETERLIRKRDPAQPFFIYTAFGAPHLPNEAPQHTIDEYQHIDDAKRRVHAAMVTELDRAVGRIESVLLDEGIAENTLIWFMSDNGGLTADSPLRFVPSPILKLALEARFGSPASPKFVEFVKDYARSGASDNRPFRGSKGSVEEGGVRVPAFAYWPGTLVPGQFEYMTTVQDVLPTLLDLIGQSADEERYDGRSILPALLTGRAPRVVPYLVQSVRLGETIAVYQYPYKLIVEEGSPKAMYKLDDDPLESQNILGEETAIVSELANYVADFPRAENIAVPFNEAMQDTDYFGGEEDREPWAEQAYW